MCIPPNDDKAEKYFKKMIALKNIINTDLKLSMGMSNDYKIALVNKSNIVRIGSLLFEETIKVAQSLKVKGMIWQVLDWNESAIRFYKKYHADISSEWYNGKLTEEQITNFKSR